MLVFDRNGVSYCATNVPLNLLTDMPLLSKGDLILDRFTGAIGNVEGVNNCRVKVTDGISTIDLPIWDLVLLKFYPQPVQAN